jgi:hypothetical protein
MLSHRQYIALQISGTAVGLAIVLGVTFVVQQFVTVAWMKWTLGVLAVACGQTASQLFCGTGSSYRKYAAAHGGPDRPPSRFWATTGQAVILVVAALFLFLLTAVANRLPAQHWLRPATGLAWVAVPGSFLLYLLVARDWRRELKSHRMLSNERCS